MMNVEKKLRKRKQKKPVPKITKIIKGAAARSDLSILALSERIGVPYSTITGIRFVNPGSWKFYEISAIFQALDFYEEEIAEITEILKKGGLQAA